MDKLKEIDEMAANVPVGSEGLIMLPHLCGTVMPENQPDAKGVFFGIEVHLQKAFEICHYFAWTFAQY